MNISLGHRTRRSGLAGWINYATAEEFESLFESKREQLLQLALLLTASWERAEQCLSLALRDCQSTGAVSTDWILPWARRAIVRTAIQLVFCSALSTTAPNLKGCEHEGDPQLLVITTSPHFDVPRIMKLPDFERVVFVTTVLEHISIRDCALLMGRSPQEVFNAQKRAVRLSSFAEHGPTVSLEAGSADGNDKGGRLFEN